MPSVVRLISLEGESVTVAGDTVVWCEGEAREASSINDPHALIRLHNGRSKGEQLYMLHNPRPSRGLDAGNGRPPVALYEVRGALVAPPPPVRPTTVPGADTAAPATLRAARRRGTVQIHTEATSILIRWPEGTRAPVIKLVLACLPKGATITAHGGAVRFSAASAVEITNALMSALADVGFAITRG